MNNIIFSESVIDADFAVCVMLVFRNISITNFFSGFSVGLVDQQLTVDIDEEHRVFVMFLEDPAASVLAVYLSLDVFAADFLFGEELVVLVEYLHVGLAVHIIHDGVHQVVADGVADHVNIICLFDIFVYHNDFGDVVVVPVAVAVQPESRPEDWARGYGMPYNRAHVYDSMVIWMVEVGCRVHRSVRRRHGAGLSGACVVVTGSAVLRVDIAASSMGTGLSARHVAASDTGVVGAACIAASADIAIVAAPH